MLTPENVLIYLKNKSRALERETKVKLNKYSLTSRKKKNLSEFREICYTNLINGIVDFTINTVFISSSWN